jgi:hypothetical protein
VSRKGVFYGLNLKAREQNRSSGFILIVRARKEKD